MQDSGLRMDLLKPERIGKGVEEGLEEEEGRSSPKRHCPQKAVQAQAATTASKGRSRSRLVISCDSMVAVTGGRGGRFEDMGARFWTPFKTYRRRMLPFHSRLWAMCQALRADKRARGVLPACLPELEAANAQSTNSSAGKRKDWGTFRESQKRMNWRMAPE